ncbi:MAG: hypothetical protein EOP51_19050 [Sphingobacteriales bacterium]|nr:MAG: hypothetical protein EOP51_19050 [Sphingobacteriales bacterium]
MKLKRVLLVLSFWLTFALQAASAQSIRVDFLRCEYLTDPLGIDNTHPRLSWLLQSAQHGAKQTAYQILAGTTAASLTEGRADLWDTKKILSFAQNQIKYSGKELNSRQYCYWKVRVWDENGKVSEWSKPAFWSMGLLQAADWKAQWIGEKPITQQRWKTEGVKLHSGYQSEMIDVADQPQSVTIDLGSVQAFDEIKLYPASPVDNKLDGFMFPVRFYIEAASDKNFSDAVKIVDKTATDVVNPVTVAAVYPVVPGKVRYVRLTVTKLTRSPFYDTKFGFALAELQVNSGSKTISTGAKVEAKDPYEIERFGWNRTFLTDGILMKMEMPPFVPIPLTPAPLLRKEFDVKPAIKHATLYVTALGVTEVTLNSKKVGEHILAPEWTDYYKRVQYQTYDVTGMLAANRNAIAATLADGWYIGPMFPLPDRGANGYDRRFLAQLEIEYDNGEKQTIATGNTWKMNTDGPLRRASIYNGESVDASKNQMGWELAGFDDSKWQEPTVDNSVKVILSAQMNEPIKALQEIKPKSVTKTGEDTYVYDMGQNMVGWCKILVRGYDGDSIRLRYAEMLNDDGTAYVDNLRGAKPVDYYIGPKESSIVIEPRFTYHGFRYLEIKGVKVDLPLVAVTGKVIASSVANTGEFNSSNKDLNQLWKNIWWTQLGNIYSVPTDCPQRDERLGWMGDAQCFSETSIYNMDMAAFYKKWMRDIMDSQRPNGEYADFAPSMAYDQTLYNAPGWGDAAIIIPWNLYQYYGDKEVLKSNFTSMRKFIDNIDKLNPNHIWQKATGLRYGDWLNGNTIVDKDYPKYGGQIPDDVFSTAYFAYSTGLMAKMAKVLGDDAAYECYSNLHNAVTKAFNDKFVTADGIIEGDTQAGYSLALSFELLPVTLRKKAAEHMLNGIKKYDNRVSTGIHSTARMMNQLSEYGYNDMAYKLLESDRFPSWLYSIRQGATTVWERWDGYVKGRGFQSVGMNSFNHYALGAVGEWMYKVIVGIRPDTTSPGFNRFIIHPQPGGSLTSASGSYQAISGKISTSWKLTGKAFTLQTTVPVNTTAVVRLPVKGGLTENSLPVVRGKDGIVSSQKKADYWEVVVGAGTYNFKVE